MFLQVRIHLGMNYPFKDHGNTDMGRRLLTSSEFLSTLCIGVTLAVVMLGFD